MKLIINISLRQRFINCFTVLNLQNNANISIIYIYYKYIYIHNFNFIILIYQFSFIKPIIQNISIPLQYFLTLIIIKITTIILVIINSVLIFIF